MLLKGRRRQVLCQCISYHLVGPTLLQLDDPVLHKLIHEVFTRVDMTCSLPVARILRHAYDGARVVIYIRWSLRAESIFEVSFVLGHMLPLHDYLHLKPLTLVLCFPAEWRLIL